MLGRKNDKSKNSNERVAYVNGKIVPESQALVSINDVGFLYGDAVFDTTRTFGHKIFRLEEHLDRFFKSLKYMRINPGLTKKEFADLTMQVLETNLLLLDDDDDYWVSQRVSRGVRGGGGKGGSGKALENPAHALLRSRAPRGPGGCSEKNVISYESE